MFNKLSRLPLTTVALIAGLVVPVSLSAISAQAQQPQTQDNQVQNQSNQNYFVRSPRLVRTATTFQEVDVPSIYQFTIKVPEDAGASLRAVRIVQDPDQRNVNFNANKSSAYLSDRLAGPTIPLASIGGEAPTDANEVMVIFDQPVAPGQTVTVALQTDRNPRTGGVYQFGVTAYPQGNDNNNGIQLGYGRVNIYDNIR